MYSGNTTIYILRIQVRWSRRFVLVGVVLFGFLAAPAGGRALPLARGKPLAARGDGDAGGAADLRPLRLEARLPDALGTLRELMLLL